MTNDKKEKKKEKAENIFLIALFLSVVLLSAFGIYTLSYIANHIAGNENTTFKVKSIQEIADRIELERERYEKINYREIESPKAHTENNYDKKEENYENNNLSKEEKIEQTVRTIPTSYIYDKAELLSNFSKQQIIEATRQLDSEQKAQIIIETIKSLEGQKIENYSSKRFTELNLEKNNYNNGILILVAPTERVIRVEVGSGLKDIFSEEEIKDIIKINGVKKCQEQNFDKAISDMFYNIKKKLTKDYSPKKTTSSDFYGVTINWN